MKAFTTFFVSAIAAITIFQGCSKSSDAIKPTPASEEIKNETNSDVKPGRFFTDQPDVNDDYQIHFNYLLAKDSEDREWDLNGKMEEILLELNDAMTKATAAHELGGGIAKKYKFDYRKDGKLDITFIRLDQKHDELDESPNNDIVPFIFSEINFWRDGYDGPLTAMNNPKKVYYNFADFSNVDGGQAGVGVGTTFLRSNRNWSKERILLNVLHELHHTQGGGYSCVPGIRKGMGHYKDQSKRLQLTAGRKLGSTYAHQVKGCPQLKDSVFLEPTSKDPYDPYALNCLFKLGKYNHPDLTNVVRKLRKAGKYNWRTKFGSNCQWRNQEMDSDGYFLLGSHVNILK